MSDKKPKPPETTKARIARDKREFDRLVKLVEKEVSPHSPEWWSWYSSEEDSAADSAFDSDDTLANLMDATAKAIQDEYDAHDIRPENLTADPEGDARRAKETADNAWGDWLESEEAKSGDSVFDYDNWPRTYVDDEEDKGKDKNRENDEAAREGIMGSVGGVTVNMGNIDIAFPHSLDEGMISLALIPGSINEMSATLGKLSDISEDTLINDGMKFIEAQKKLRAQIEEAGLR